MYPSQVLELIDRGLPLRNPKFVLQFTRGSNPHTELLLLDLLLLEVIQRV